MSMLYFKEARPKDFESYYKLKCQADAVLWSGFKTAPDEEKIYHHYINNILNNGDVYLYFLYEDQEIVGCLQGSRINDESVEIGASNIYKKFQGCGYIEDLTKFFIDKMKNIGYKKAICWVSDKNIPSEHNTTINKFIKTTEFEIRNLPLLGGEHKFFKWVKILNE